MYFPEMYFPEMYFPEKDSFINIHTHKGFYDEGEFALLNIFAQEYSSYNRDNKYVYSVGLHPWHAAEEIIGSGLVEIERAAKENNVIAIGEAGLDRAKRTDMDLQMRAFVPQLEIAEEYKKPVMLHCVRSYSEMISIRKKHRFRLPWIFHGFTGNIQTAGQLISHGCYLSFGKFLLNNKSRIPELFSHIPDDKIFLEIDDSDYKIQEVYRRACELKGYSPRKIKEIILKNFNRCFFDG